MSDTSKLESMIQVAEAELESATIMNKAILSYSGFTMQPGSVINEMADDACRQLVYSRHKLAILREELDRQKVKEMRATYEPSNQGNVDKRT